MCVAAYEGSFSEHKFLCGYLAGCCVFNTDAVMGILIRCVTQCLCRWCFRGYFLMCCNQKHLPKLGILSCNLSPPIFLTILVSETHLSSKCFATPKCSTPGFDNPRSVVPAPQRRFALSLFSSLGSVVKVCAHPHNALRFSSFPVLLSHSPHQMTVKFSHGSTKNYNTTFPWGNLMLGSFLQGELFFVVYNNNTQNKTKKCQKNILFLSLMYCFFISLLFFFISSPSALKEEGIPPVVQSTPS